LKKISDLKEFFTTTFFITKMFSAFVKHLIKRDSTQQKSKKTTFLLLSEVAQTSSSSPNSYNKDKASTFLTERRKTMRLIRQAAVQAVSKGADPTPPLSASKAGRNNLNE
jgi:hypothetical protein